MFKTISLLLILSFLFQEISFANPDLKPLQWNEDSKPSLKWARQVLPDIPESVATIEDAWQGVSKGRDLSDTKTLILIQDAHTNNSAQLNTSKALDLILKEKKDIQYIFSEAATGENNLSFLRPYASLEKRKQIARSYLQKGLLHGVEYLDLTTDHHFVLWGVEDPKLYVQSVETYASVIKDREKFQDYLKRIEVTIKTLKLRIYNPFLLSFDQNYQKYQKAEISLTDYFEVLTNQAKKLDLSLTAYPHLRILHKLKELESKIDFKKASQEEQKAIESLPLENQKELSQTQKEQNNLFKLSINENKTQKAFFTLLEEKLDPSRYPELSKYFTYLKEAKKINPNEILKEQKLLEREIFKTLATNSDEENLIKASLNLDYLKKLLNLVLTPDEYKEYQSKIEDFDISKITGFLNKKIMDLRQYYDDAVFLEEGYEETIKRCETFYELTYKRDRAFIHNLLQRLGAEGSDPSGTAILISGGYHSPNLKYLLKQQGISYISLTPQVLRETNQKRYERILLSQDIQKAKTLLGSSTVQMPQSFNMTTYVKGTVLPGPEKALKIVTDIGGQELESLSSSQLMAGARMAASSIHFAHEIELIKMLNSYPMEEVETYQFRDDASPMGYSATPRSSHLLPWAKGNRHALRRNLEIKLILLGTLRELNGLGHYTSFSTGGSAFTDNVGDNSDIDILWDWGDPVLESLISKWNYAGFANIDSSIFHHTGYAAFGRTRTIYDLIDDFVKNEYSNWRQWLEEQKEFKNHIPVLDEYVRNLEVHEKWLRQQGARMAIQGAYEVPEDTAELIQKLEETYKRHPNPHEDPILNHPAHSTQTVTFFSVGDSNVSEIEEFRRQAFGKVGPLFVTKKDGVILPMVGDFYALVRAHKYNDGRIEIVVKKLTDDEIHERYGFLRIKDGSGKAYTTTSHTLVGLIGRLSIFPGDFGWVELQHDFHEQPIRAFEDLFQAIFTGDKITYRKTRLEVKGLGAPHFKSIHSVPDTETGERIVLMPTRNAEPIQNINFTLLAEDGKPVPGVDFKRFLSLPGAFADGQYQPHFLSAPGLEHFDQYVGVKTHQDRVRANGVQSPDHAFYFHEFGDHAAPHVRRHAASIRMTLNERPAMRLVELLDDYEKARQHGDASRSYFGQRLLKGQMLEETRTFLNRIGRNLRAMSNSGLYMFPNGNRTVAVQERVMSTMLHAEVLQEVIVSQAQGVNNLMGTDEAFVNVLNNDSWDGRFADLAEYAYGLPATDEFAIKLMLHLLARILERFVEIGLLTEEEASSPQLLESFLLGVMGGHSGYLTGYLQQLNITMPSFPKPGIFELTRESQPNGGNIFDIKVHSEDGLEKLLDRVGAGMDPHNSRDLIYSPSIRSIVYEREKMKDSSFLVLPSKILRAFAEVYDGLLDISTSNQNECYQQVVSLTKSVWAKYWPQGTGSEPEAEEIKSLFLGLEWAMMNHGKTVFVQDRLLTLVDAIERFNQLVSRIRSTEYWTHSNHIARIANGELIRGGEPVHILQNTEKLFSGIHLPQGLIKGIINSYLSSYAGLGKYPVGEDQMTEWKDSKSGVVFKVVKQFESEIKIQSQLDSHELYVAVNMSNLAPLGVYEGSQLNGDRAFIRNRDKDWNIWLVAFMPESQMDSKVWFDKEADILRTVERRFLFPSQDYRQPIYVYRDTNNPWHSHIVLEGLSDNDRTRLESFIRFRYDSIYIHPSVASIDLTKWIRSQFSEGIGIIASPSPLNPKTLDIKLSGARMAVNYSRYFVDQDAIQGKTADEVGKKGENLLVMRKLGMPVPDFMIITTELIRENPLRSIDFEALADAVLERFPKKLGEHFELVVRPAGVVNMPGILDTVKGVSDRQSLTNALRHVYESWDNPSAVEYRMTNGISEKSGLAIVVQMEVHGDKGTDSASGAFYTRNPNTGANSLFGNYYINSPGEKTMSGSSDPGFRSVHESMKDNFPAVYQDLLRCKGILEKHYQYPQEVEFVIEKGVLYFTQTVNADLPPDVESRVMQDMVKEGIGSVKKLTLAMVKASESEVMTYGIRNDAKVKPIAETQALARGAVDGFLVFSLREAEKMRTKGKKAVLVAQERTDTVLQALIDRKVDGLITFYGNFNMHDARIARENGIPAVAVLQNRQITDDTLVVNNAEVKGGERIAIDGTRGRILLPLEENILEPMEGTKVVSLPINVREIKTKIQEKYGDFPYEHLAVLHSVLAANVQVLAEKKSDIQNVLELDVATYGIHEILNQKVMNLNKSPEEIALALHKIFEGYLPFIRTNDQRQEFLKLRNVEEFFRKADTILDHTVNKYLKMEIASIEYPNFKDNDFFESVEGNTEVPIEFSILLKEPNVDFRHENLEALRQAWEAKVLVPYVMGDKHFDTEKSPSLSVENAVFYVDPMDPFKIRVKGTIEFPEYNPKLSFTVRLETSNPIKPELSQRKRLKFPSKQIFSGMFFDYEPTSITLIWHLLPSNLSERIERLTHGVKLIPSEGGEKKLFTIDTAKEAFEKELGESFSWRVKTQKIATEYIGYYTEKRGKVVMDGKDWKWLYESEAYAGMLNKLILDSDVSVETIEWSVDHDMEENHLLGSFPYRNYFYETKINLNRKIVDRLIQELLRLQELVNIEPLLKFDQKGNTIGVDIENLIVALYLKHQDSLRGARLAEGAVVADLNEGNFNDFVIGIKPNADASISVLLDNKNPSILSFKKLTNRSIQVLVGGKPFRMIKTARPIKGNTAEISPTDLINLLRQLNQKYNRTLSQELAKNPIEAYLYLDSYKGLPEEVQDSLIATQLVSLVSHRTPYKAVHLVGEDDLVKKAQGFITSIRALQSKQHLFVTGDNTLYPEASQIHVSTKKYFLDHKDTLRKDPKRRFVTLDNIYYDKDKRTLDIIAFNPVTSLIEMVGGIEELKKDDNALSVAHHFFKEITGFNLTKEEFLGFLEGQPDLVNRFALPPTIRAIDINLALKVWSMAARMASQAA